MEIGSDTTDDTVTTELNNRAADIETIYTSEDIYTVEELIDKYNISYIYVGPLRK